MNTATTQNETQRVFYELAPILPISQWWHVLLLAVSLVLLATFVIWLYRTDAARLPKTTAMLLTSLRLTALVGVFIFFLSPQRRSEIQIVQPSRVAILVDTSLSMGLNDRNGDHQNGSRRIDQVIELLGDTPVVEQLRRKHEIAVYRFDESDQVEAIANLPIVTAGEQPPSIAEQQREQARKSLVISRKIGIGAQALLGLGVLMLLAHLVLVLMGRRAALLLAVGTWSLVIAVAGVAFSDLVSSEFHWRVSLGWSEHYETNQFDETQRDDAAENVAESAVDWQKSLQPRGASTRLGQALLQIVKRNRGEPIAAVILATDGQHNQGVPPVRAISAAIDAHTPIYTIGFGTNRPHRNVRVSDIQAPARVFPGDRFTVKAVLQANGLSGQSAIVQLLSLDEKGEEAETDEDEQQVTLGDDDMPTVVEFTVKRQEEGRRRYLVRVVTAADVDQQDDELATLVEIVQRKSRVLLVAGGPSRDYQFLRNQLYRDRDIVLDVWLQIAKSGADQESDRLLLEFPRSAEELDQYDTIVAFDPDWRLLDEKQAEFLERWVSYKAGGLVVIAGPVYTPEWTRRPRGEEAIDRIRRLYPVAFYNQGSAALKLGRFGGDQAFPLAFTREGASAEFLKLGDSMAESAQNWSRFRGVFGYYAVNEPKPGADVLAHFSDPSTAIDGQLPIYLATHFYGAGRVLFQASGEIWRLREVDVDFFQRYYLNAIRWVSQGRLLRDSSQGVLLVDRDQSWVGDPVTVRALLRNAADQPLEIPSVVAAVEMPDGSSRTIELTNEGNAASPGAYSTQLTTELEGNYRIRLPVPESADAVLTAEIRAGIPDLEKKDPRRNDALLREIADKTGGTYFVGSQAAAAADGGLQTRIVPVDQETFLPGTPDSRFATKLMGWLVGWLTLILSLEWIIRRFQKLA